MITTTSRQIARQACTRTPRTASERWVTTGGTRRPRGLRISPFAARHTWSRAGLHKLVAAAQTAYTAQTGVYLPHNLEVHGPWVGCGYGTQTARRDEMVGAAARVAGFLRAVAADPKRYRLVARLIRRATSPNGMNSPATSLDLYALVGRSPGWWEHFIRRVSRRADAILVAYGLRVSWRAIAETITRGCRRPHKAALSAAARTADVVGRRLGFYPPDLFWGCEKSRHVLIRLRGLGVLLADARASGQSPPDRRWSGSMSPLSGACAAAIQDGLATTVAAAIDVVRDGIVDAVGAATLQITVAEYRLASTFVSGLVAAAAAPPPAENDGGEWLLANAALEDFLLENYP